MQRSELKPKVGNRSTVKLSEMEHTLDNCLKLSLISPLHRYFPFELDLV